MSPSEKVKYISNWIKSYVDNMPSKAEALVIGISGGIDSSVSSTLSAMTGLKTIVLSMPIKQKENQHDLSLKHQKWLVEKFKNVRVENEGDISQWIAAAEYIIHSGSTTGIQSHIMDKKVLLYYTKATKKRENAFPNNFGKKCANKYQILKNLDIKKSKKNNTSLVSKRILIDNNFASKKIVSNLSKIKIIKNNKYKFLTPSILNLYFLKNKISFLRGELPKSKRVLRTYDEKIPNGIKLNEVKEFLDKLINYFNLQKLIKIRYCGPNCFLIYNKNI